MSRYLLFFAAAASCAACASIFDFEDPTAKIAESALGDAGTTTATVPSTSSTSYAAPLDASIAIDAALKSPVSHGPVDLADGGSCACPPSVTSDWQGPFVVASTSDGTMPAACDGAYPTEAYAGFSGASADPAACSCTCGDPTNVACSTPPTTLFSDPNCTSSCTSVATTLACVAPTSYTCDLLGLTKPKAMTIGASVPSGGSCLPTAKVTIPTPTWTSAIRLCSAPTAPACGDAGCPATPSPAFATDNRCVTKPGDNACPAGYPTKQLFQGSATDTRACMACACGAPAQVECVAGVSTANGASCSSASPLTTPTSCLAVAPATHLTVGSASAQGGSCQPSGGAPKGAFTEDAGTTVCCLE